MEAILHGVNRISFKNSDGDLVRMGFLYVESDFDEDTEECAGRQVAKMSFDYDAIPELIGLHFPVSVDLQINLKGKCKKVILKKGQGNGNDGK